MVMHMLKSDPMLRDLKHIQVDGLGMAYLYFFNKQGRHGLTHEAAQAMQVHIREAFTEWISCSAHFAVNPFPLVEGWCCVVSASKQCRHQLWAKCQGLAIPTLALSESDSIPQLIGSAPTSVVGVGSEEENRSNKSG